MLLSAPQVLNGAERPAPEHRHLSARPLGASGLPLGDIATGVSLDLPAVSLRRYVVHEYVIASSIARSVYERPFGIAPLYESTTCCFNAYAVYKRLVWEATSAAFSHMLWSHSA